MATVESEAIAAAVADVRDDGSETDWCAVGYAVRVRRGEGGERVIALARTWYCLWLALARIALART